MYKRYFTIISLFSFLLTAGCWEDDGNWSENLNNENNVNNNTCIGEAPDAQKQLGICQGSKKICITDDGDSYYWGEPDYTKINGYEVDEISCDNIDNDCDGETDEGLTETYYPDRDNDGFGDENDAGVEECEPPLNYVADNSDCNDENADEYPGAVFYADLDGDGYGDPDNTVESCLQPEGYVLNSDDCNDDPDNNGALVYPGAVELCDGIDNDCNGIIDDNTTEVEWYPDLDGDGFGDMDATPVLDCAPPTDHVQDNTDCNDNPGEGEQINPDALEICDGIDNNCDSIIDTVNTCSVNAHCEDVGGTTNAFCQCNSGFSGDGVTCTDIDECTANTDNCDNNATCTNTPGSFTCTCNEGWEGDGVNCTDIDECALSTDNCDPNAACTNTPGSFTCACNEGWEGDGLSCTDINECTANTDNCDVNAACTNTVGAYECTCNEGWEGDGFSCTDFDECVAGTDTCDPNADCINTTGDYFCSCQSGYTGDGFTCTDVNECASGTDECDPDAICSNTEGSYECTCSPGYTGDGFDCYDIDECAEGTDTCDPNAICQNTAGSFSCSCLSGYTGDGYTCEDIPCYNQVGVGGCATNATCDGTLVSDSCVCQSGYVGDPINEPGCDDCDSAGGYVSDGSGGCLLAPAPATGDLVVNELHLEPLAVPAVDGQWFEIFNTTDATLNLANLEIEVDGVVHALASTSWFLPPAAYIVIGPNDDTVTNGGVELDITFVTMPQLSTDGTITLSLPGSPAVTIDELVWSSDWNHNSSHSLALSPGALEGDMVVLNDNLLHWCHTKTSNFGSGDFGTPGSENDPCSVDYCHLQYPATTEVNQFTSTELIYGRVYEASSTPGGGQGAFISAQVGFGNENSVPDDSWTWFSTNYNGDYDGLTAGDLANDEYAGSMDATILGPFDYAYRFTLDGGLSWTYCDLDGSDNGYQTAQAGLMTVLPEAPKLFISEYVEGSSFNKAIEVYNNTGGDYDLANCSIMVYFNGNTGSTSSVTLTGILISGDVHVLCDDSADPALLSLCDQTHTQSWFNGNDAVVLNCEGSDVDVIGQVGYDPGTEWGSGDESTADNTLVRDCSITTGDSNTTDVFDPTNGDWVGYPIDTFTNLGSHTTCY